MAKKRKEKTAQNNQWAGTDAGNSGDYQEKTEYSNEWESTNKTTGADNIPSGEDPTQR